MDAAEAAGSAALRTSARRLGAHRARQFRLHFGALMRFTTLAILVAATAVSASSMAPSVAAQAPTAPA